MPVERIDTVVIGAGQAGLGVSRELVGRGIEHVVLEQGRVGQTWRSQRWDAFRLNTPGSMNVLPGAPAPTAPDAFASAPEFVLGLERYAFSHRLPIRDGVTVGAVTHDRGAGFTVATGDGVVRARAVVVATGAARVPRVPRLARALTGRILQLHTAGYRNPGALPPGAVLVVGGAQSGVQIAEDLLAAGRDVYVATSRVGRLRRRYRGRDSLAWLVDEGYLDERRAPTATRPPRQPQISGAGGGHTLSYQHLQRRGAVLLGGVAGAGGEGLALRDDLAANCAFADASSAEYRRRIDRHIARTGADAPEPEPDPADEPHARGALPHGPAALDLRAAGVSTVIWATGFGGDDGRWLRAPVLDGRGEIVHRDGVTAVPGLFVVGRPWLRTRRSAMIYGVAADAPHVAGLVAGRMVGERAAA